MTKDQLSTENEKARMEAEDEQLVDRPLVRTTKYIYLVTVLSAVGGFLFGYDTGVVSGAMLFLKEEFQLEHTWQEIIVSSTIAAAWIFSILAGFLTSGIGRKPVILMASFVFTGGAVMMGVSRSKYVLLGGRIVVGIGIGLASMTVPMYIGEVAPLEIRGKLITINNCFITGGQFAASLIDGFFSKDKINGWRYMLGIAGIPSFIQFFGFLYMPESPRWLISKGYYEKAISVLKQVRGSKVNIQQEFDAIKNNFLETEQERKEAGGSSSILMQVLRHTALRRALLVGCSLQMFQQIAGINTVMYYSATIIQMAGYNDPSQAIWLASATASVNFACTFIGLLLVEKWGRRLLTLGSLAGVIFSLLLLAIGFHITAAKSPRIFNHNIYDTNVQCFNATTCSECTLLKECGYCFPSSDFTNGTCLQVNKNKTDSSYAGSCFNHTKEDVWAYDWCPSNYSWLMLLGLFLYLFFFAPGMGPMPWTINSEIYPLWARSTCYALATSVNWMFNLLVSMTFLTLTQAITKYGTFYLYVGFAVVGWVVFFLFLPETKGKTLEEVESLFSCSLWEDGTTRNEEKMVQYVHIRGISCSRTYEDQDSGEDN
ncbi:proton myo-inositol cotransporter-like isoform X1 [Centruroides vittatus]|uniref:proton myo-inositol cotransporter-like isoform X1 n=2 Tax=Centruroides vittatus TaxID=120091 RepID=UPI0035103406